MKKILEKNKIILLLAFYMFFFPPLILWSVLPYLKKIQEKSDNIQAKLIDNEISEVRFKKISDMEDTYREYERNESAFNVVLKSENEVGFINKVEEIASETGNKIFLKVIDDVVNKSEKKAIARGQEEKPIKEGLSHKDYLLLEITISGEYVNLVNFMNKLENMDLYVNTLSINSREERFKDENYDNHASADGLFDSSAFQGDRSLSEAGSVGKTLLKSVIIVAVYIKK